MFALSPVENRRPWWTFAVSFTAQTLLLILPFFLPHSTRAHLAQVHLPSRDQVLYAPDTSEVIALANVDAVDNPKLAVVEKTASPAAAPRHAAAPAPESGAPDGSADSPDDSSSVGVLASDGGWMIDPQPASYIVMQHHEVHPATPIYTPDPDVLHHVTESARGANLVFQVVINEDGLIAQATILKGGDLDVVPAICDSLRQWLFVPAKMNGVPVASTRLLMFHLPG